MIMQSVEGGVKGTESPLPYLPFGNIKRKQSSDDINTVEPRNNKGPKDWQTAFALTCTITKVPLYRSSFLYIYISVSGAKNIIQHFVAQRFDVPHCSNCISR